MKVYKPQSNAKVTVTLTIFRNHDMQSFMYLLTLEFWRLVQDDRKAFSYVA